jgi:hypothetical protein
MSRATVTRLFIASLIAFAAGAILAIAAVALAIASDAFVTAGSDLVGIRGSGLAWSLLGLGLIGALVVAGGLMSGLVAWIGALLNTWQLESRAWFAVLLLLGIFNFGFVAMIAYIITGPDGQPEGPRRSASAPAGA